MADADAKPTAKATAKGKRTTRTPRATTKSKRSTQSPPARHRRRWPDAGRSRRRRPELNRPACIRPSILVPADALFRPGNQWFLGGSSLDAVSQILTSPSADTEARLVPSGLKATP